MAEDRPSSLRAGFTTGTAAAAAVKGAVMALLDREPPAEVGVRLLTGREIRIPIHAWGPADGGGFWCTVIKDAGDDPDITHGAEIGVRVRIDAPRLGADPDESFGDRSIVITGGPGVGRVTKPGLEVPPGEPAINPGPRRMIREAVADVLNGRSVEGTVSVEVFVPRGIEMAQKTLNRRLGILGGISILGTTGVVKPLSHEAYRATIISALSVARAAGCSQVVLTTGRRSERHAQGRWAGLPEEAFIQMGDFFEAAMTAGAEAGFARMTLAVFFGKAVKMAQGIPHTHAAKSAMTLTRLAGWTRAAGAGESLAAAVAGANTARHAFDLLKDRPAVIAEVGRRMVESARAFAGPSVALSGVIFDYDGGVVFDAEGGAPCPK